MSNQNLSTEDLVRSLLDDYRIAHSIDVAVTLRIPDLCAGGSPTIAELARATGAEPDPSFRLLRALASIEFLTQPDPTHFALTPVTAQMLARSPTRESIRSLPGGLPHEREAWENLGYSVMTGDSAFRHVHGVSSWDYHNAHEALGARLHENMSLGTQTWAGSILAAYSFAEVKCVVDVGGGHGALLAAILRSYPDLRGILFDQASVVTGAASVLKAAGVAARCDIVAGDFRSSVPAGGDLYLCKSIMHNWNDTLARRILQNCRAVMSSNSKLVLVEPVIEPDNPFQSDKFFMDLHMLVIHGARERTADEFSALCSSAGFRLTRIIPTEMMGSVIEAVPE